MQSTDIKVSNEQCESIVSNSNDGVETDNLEKVKENKGENLKESTLLGTSEVNEVTSDKCQQKYVANNVFDVDNNNASKTQNDVLSKSGSNAIVKDTLITCIVPSCIDETCPYEETLHPPIIQKYLQMLTTVLKKGTKVLNWR